MFNNTNWNNTCFQSSTLKVILSLGGDFNENEEVEVEYFVTVLNQDQQEVYQHNFVELKEAILFANDRYSSWEFSELVKKSESGCGTCEAPENPLFVVDIICHQGQIRQLAWPLY